MLKSAAIISLILVAAFFISCSSGPTGPDGDMLTGSWNWAKSYGGNLDYNDPQSCGCSQYFVFEKDNIYMFFYDNVVVDSGAYEITDIQKVSDTEYSIMFTLNGAEAIGAIRGDELIMFPDPACLSCPDSIFFNKLYPI